MSRAHDIGGQTGFGPVLAGGCGGSSPRGNAAGGCGGSSPRGNAAGGNAAGGDEQPFAADWEARVYALNAVLRRRGVFSTDQMRDAIERIPPREYLAASYYERWLLAIEALLDSRLPAGGD